jgi:NDP-sugar pyrophosphorylase family protein
MRAILIATGGRNGAEPLIERYPDPLLPLLDRPFLQHVIEYLARQGVREFEIVLSHRPETVEGYFGDGTRWGCRFTYHLARDPQRPYRVLKTLEITDDEPVLLGHADRLPAMSIAELAEDVERALPLVDEDDAGKITWTGWAFLPANGIAAIAADWTEAMLAEHLLALPDDHVVDHLLDTGSFAAMLASQRTVLEKAFPPLFLTGREVEPGVWLSRNVSIHPTAKVVAPVYVGEDCRIGAGAQVGPHAVIGRGCILGRGCIVSNSLVFPENYVGADLELSDVIVDRNRILRSEGTVTEADAFLLGSLSVSRKRSVLAKTGARLLALGLLLLTSPLLLATALFLKIVRRGPVLYRSRAVIARDAAGTRRRTATLWSFVPPGHAARGGTPGFRNLVLVCLPALFNIVRGELNFAGVAPRTPEEVEKLPPEWRTLYLCCKVGLITETGIRANNPCNDDERYAAEAYYAAAADWRFDARLISAYLYLALLPLRTARSYPAI